MKIIRFINDLFNSNTYLIEFQNKSVVIIDPCENELLFIHLKLNNLFPVYVFLTHEHIDHISGTNMLKNIYPKVKIVCSNFSMMAIGQPKLNLSFFYNINYSSVPADIPVSEKGLQLKLENIELNLYTFGGHSKGGLFIVINNTLFTGDQFIKNIKTVTKLPGGSKEKLMDSFLFLKNNFDKKTIIYPGHGESFSIENLRIW